MIEIATRSKDAGNLAECLKAVGHKIEHAVDHNDVDGGIADAGCKQVGWVSLDKAHVLLPGVARPMLLGRKVFCDRDSLRRGVGPDDESALAHPVGNLERTQTLAALDVEHALAGEVVGQHHDAARMSTGIAPPLRLGGGFNIHVRCVIGGVHASPFHLRVNPAVIH